MFGMDHKKLQGQEIPAPPEPGSESAEGVIVSPDTLRENRIPPRQSRTLKWPVLDASGAPKIDLERWTFHVSGLLDEKNGKPMTWSWQQFQQLPRVKVFADFHCVTRWSRLGNLWEGVSTKEIIQQVGGISPRAKYVLVYGHDYGWTTNLPLEHFLADDALVAFTHDGEPLSAEHGGPARLIIPQLYAWKSAKWVAGLEFRESDKAGYWEEGGYHMRGNPWKEERFR